MLADNDAAQTPVASQGTRPDGNETAATATPWSFRWVDVEPTLLGARVVETAPVGPPAFTSERKAEPLVTLRGMVFMCVAFVLMIGTIKILVIALIYERRRTESNYGYWRSR